MGWGQLLGGAAGFFLGGPSGAALGASLGGSVEEATGGGASGAATDATNAANAASDRNSALQQRMYEENIARQKPFYEAGVNALPGYVSGIAPGGELVRGFTQADYQADPGYAFRLSEGQKALDRQAAARGGLISGGALKAAQAYGQNMGSQEYQNAFNRYQTERQAQLGPLQSLAGVGQSATNTLGAAGQQYGQNVGNALINQGYAAGNAGLGAYQANQSMYGNLGSAIGGVSTGDWTKAGNALTSWLNTPSQNSGGYSNLEF